MAYDGKNNRLRRKDAVGMEELVSQFVREMKLVSGLNRQRVAEARNVVSGAGRYTLSTAYEKGVLTCFISSSLVRNQLYFQRDVLQAKINEYLAADELFVDAPDGSPAVKTIVLK
jgi:hypothetical protein